MITAMSLTNGTLTVVLDCGAEILTARNDHPKWTQIVEAFKAGNEAVLQSLLSLKTVVENYSVGELSINTTGVTYRGQPMHSVDSNRVMAFLRDGLPFKPLANYMARKMANPSARAISELYNFLEHKNMPITPEGKIIAYKGVNLDFYSVRGNTATVVVQGEVNSEGQILNTVGSTVEVERSSVDDDFRQGCSFGLHAGSLQYATGWGRRVVLVEIDPADVVSVPEDCGCQKLRCCKYKVIGEYTGPMPEAFTDEFSGEDDGNYENEETCDRCGNEEIHCVCVEDPCNCGLPECPECSNGISDPELDQPCDFCACVPADPTLDEALLAISSRCLEILTEHLMLAPVNLPDEKLFSELDIDELDEVELCMAMEHEFGVELPDEDLEEIFKTKTVSDLVDYIYRKLNPTPTVVETVDSDPDAFYHQTPEDKYLEGMQDGVRDRAAFTPPKYLSGDQTGADSDLHAKYIDGYVTGYA